MSNVTEKIKALQAKRVALEKEIREDGAALMAEAAAEIFAANPVLLSFGWTQYTPTSTTATNAPSPPTPTTSTSSSGTSIPP